MLLLLLVNTYNNKFTLLLYCDDATRFNLSRRKPFYTTLSSLERSTKYKVGALTKPTTKSSQLDYSKVAVECTQVESKNLLLHMHSCVLDDVSHDLSRLICLLAVRRWQARQLEAANCYPRLLIHWFYPSFRAYPPVEHLRLLHCRTDNQQQCNHIELTSVDRTCSHKLQSQLP